MRKRPIVVTESDERKLRGLLRGQSEESMRDRTHLQELQSELERALVLRAEEVPTDVITMHSRIRVLDLVSRRQSNYTLVFPLESDISARRISVLAPLGTALLGFREGDEVEWMMPGGMRRLRVEGVRQPAEAREFEGVLSRAPISADSRVVSAMLQT
jgi:regulator of nucleoside diphosphate kinase